MRAVRLLRLLPLAGAVLLAAPAGAADGGPACTYTELANIPLRYTGPALEITLGGEIQGTPARMAAGVGAVALQWRPPLQPAPDAMFTPSSHDVRRFFCEALRKQRAGEILTPMDAIAADWIAQHPEYDEALSDVDAALERDYSVEGGQANPFLHLSMHLSIAEQVSVDQPRGIRAAHDALAARLGAHEAHHEIMECLGEMIWRSQRAGLPPDTDAYVECVRKRC